MMHVIVKCRFTSGSGGTEAQDWTEILLHVPPLGWKAKGFKTELMEVSDGDMAGFKSATNSYQWRICFRLVTYRNRYHRLVRIKSPFDSNNRRHTSFGKQLSFILKLMMILILKLIRLDFRIDVYRASGAGGQTSIKLKVRCVLLTCLSGIVVQCQNDRSPTQK